ncbi:MAG: ribosomal protein S18-alanine N-acetyltransferase [Arcanobacterium sp.]|nr:ribosomal protein S18-alanine N-acetyltransferase [Arcanobacterium sp.]MDY5589529.1 ribosomal protein S18-alanine N-acetyltransferase [Arcanobacterium sp.]
MLPMQMASSCGRPIAARGVENLGISVGAVQVVGVPAHASWAGRVADFDRRIFGKDAWPRSVWEHELRQSDRLYLVVLGAADPIRSFPPIVAIAGIRAAEDAEVLTVAVAPQQRRQGIAQALLTQLFEWVRLRGAQQVFLEVRASDVGAQALYQRFGFEGIASRRHYYSDDDALVMRMVIPPNNVLAAGDRTHTD